MHTRYEAAEASVDRSELRRGNCGRRQAGEPVGAPRCDSLASRPAFFQGFAGVQELEDRGPPGARWISVSYPYSRAPTNLTSAGAARSLATLVVGVAPSRAIAPHALTPAAAGAAGFEITANGSRGGSLPADLGEGGRAGQFSRSRDLLVEERPMAAATLQ